MRQARRAASLATLLKHADVVPVNCLPPAVAREVRHDAAPEVTPPVALKPLHTLGSVQLLVVKHIFAFSPRQARSFWLVNEFIADVAKQVAEAVPAKIPRDAWHAKVPATVTGRVRLFVLLTSDVQVDGRLC